MVLTERQRVRLRANQTIVSGRTFRAGSTFRILRIFENNAGQRVALGDDAGNVLIPGLPFDRVEPVQP